MLSVLVLVILAVLLGKLIDSIGKDTIGEFFWLLYTKLSLSSDIKTLRTNQRKAVKLYTDRSNTSSKDEFAKWAKLDREYAKVKTQIDEVNKSLNRSKTTLKTGIKGALYVINNGSKMYLRWAYRKAAVVWLPAGLLPNSALWFISLSSAPKGSISVSFWLMIVNSAISNFINTLVAVYKVATLPSTTSSAKPSTASKQPPSGEKVSAKSS